MDGMRLVFETQLLDHSDKVVHYLTRMLAGDALHVAATCEALEIQVDLATRRSAPFSALVMDYLAEMARAHACLPLPQSVGTAIGIRR